MKKLIIDTLEQLRGSIEVTSELVYIARTDWSHSIGTHTRHCLNHYASFFASFDTKKINYDRRVRIKDIEENKFLALNVIQGYLDHLRSLDDQFFKNEVWVEYQIDEGADHFNLVRSSYARECHFVAMHTLHHLAQMKFLAQFQGADWPKQVGLAYSTLSYQHKEIKTENVRTNA